MPEQFLSGHENTYRLAESIVEDGVVPPRSIQTANPIPRPFAFLLPPVPVPLTLTCTKCGQKLAISDDLKGKQVQCPKCREVYLVEKRSSSGTPSNGDPSASGPRQASSSRAPSSTQATPSTQAPTTPVPSRPISAATSVPHPGPAGATTPSNQVSDPSIATCPSCQTKMRIPIAPGITDFQCPQCQNTIHITPPEVHVPTAVYSQPSAIDEDPFANLHQAPMPAPPTRPREADYSAPSTTSSSNTGFESTEAPSMLVPGLLIAVPFGLVTMATLAILAITAMKGESVQDTQAFNTVLILHTGMLINFVLVFAGSLRMITGCGKVITILTCLFALVPTICMGALFYGAFLYPVVMVGSIWGLVSLAMHHNPALKKVSFGGRKTPSTETSTTNAGDYLRRAESELRQQPTEASNDSGLKAVGLLIGGLALLALAAFNMYTMYRYYQGEIEVRRPARGIASSVFCVITGFGLVARALSAFGR